MKYRAKAKLLKQELQLHDWEFEFGPGGFSIKKEVGDASYKFVYYSSEEKLDASLWVNKRILPIEYIYDKFFDGRKSYTISIGAKYRKFTLPSQDADIDVVAISIWKAQWFEEVLPQMNRFENYKEILKEHERLEFPNNFIGGNSFAKKLIFKKFIDETLFKDYSPWVLDRSRKFIEDTTHERYQIRKASYDATSNLIDFLKDLDVTKYFKEKPWRLDKSENQIVKIKDSIVLDRTSMIAIDKKITFKEVAQLFNITGKLKKDELLVAESMIMDFSNAIGFDLLDNNEDSTILFIHNPELYDRFDIKTASKIGRAMRFMMDEGPSDSYSISYAVDGDLFLDFAIGNGESITNMSKPEFDLHDDDPRKMIDTIFEKVTGRSFLTILQTDNVTRYTV